MASLVSGAGHDIPLVVLVGPTASGKTTLAMELAQEFGGEIVSCDSVAVYRGMELGTAKPTVEQRARIPHHMIDVAFPDQPCTAGDYSRMARTALGKIAARGCLPIVAGGTGLYLRALIDGLFPAPPHIAGLRDRLRRRDRAHLHRLLMRLDANAAAAIHAHDVAKVVRAIELVIAGKKSVGAQWDQGRDSLRGYQILKLGLDPPRKQLYERINARAADMFDHGLVVETEGLLEQYGYDCRPLSSLGYAEAVRLLLGKLDAAEAVRRAQQGHRNYAKRQLTWFRRDAGIRWLSGFGEDEDVRREATNAVRNHLAASSCEVSAAR